MLLSFNRDDLFYSDQISKALSLKVTLALSKKVISYFDNADLLPTDQLIERGECDYVEFKESICKQNIPSIVRSLSAFMNLNGGTVICGVDGKGHLRGLSLSVKEFDEMQKKVFSIINSRLGVSFSSYVSFDLEEIGGKYIVRIECESSSSPVFYKEFNKNGHEREMFVIRSGSMNVHMKKTSEVIAYVQDRFKR